MLNTPVTILDFRKCYSDSETRQSSIGDLDASAERALGEAHSEHHRDGGSSEFNSDATSSARHAHRELAAIAKKPEAM